MVTFHIFIYYIYIYMYIYKMYLCTSIHAKLCAYIKKILRLLSTLRLIGTSNI